MVADIFGADNGSFLCHPGAHILGTFCANFILTKTLRVENERIKALNNKIIIYTEGKTDVKYLKLAFQKLDGYEDISPRIEYYDIEHAKNTGDGELDKIYDYLQKGNDTNIKICMFDRDNSKYILSNQFVRGKNQVYNLRIKQPHFDY